MEVLTRISHWIKVRKKQWLGEDFRPMKSKFLLQEKSNILLPAANGQHSKKQKTGSLKISTTLINNPIPTGTCIVQ
ncbi:hypothetical protein KL86SPO_40699 [uncultured Sporomusa sp.]|uniref:Uncharacterized protein n=1 Tax=uncultured Sporomusa sp. TaxID=307249 RepID=A0A212LX53_9FIRM|nr:hypothetical protein KL86SPO_40699 [uncultured Sporomusa sp.]